MGSDSRHGARDGLDDAHVHGGVAEVDAGAAHVDRSELTALERETLPAAYHFARTNGIGRGTEEEFLERLPAARWHVTRMLLAELIRESPPFLPDAVVSPVDDATVSPIGGEFPPGGVEDRIDRLLRSRSNPRSPVTVVPFPASEAVVFAPVAGVHGYGRLRLAPPATSVTPATSGRIDHPVEVVDLVEREGGFPGRSHADRFRRYMAQSVANLALAMLAGERLAREVPDATAVFRSSPGGTRPTEDPTVLLERLAAVREYRSKAAAKTRIGITPMESLLYAPEFADAIDLRFVAVPREDALVASTSNGPALSEYAREAFDGLDAAIESSLPLGATPEAYAVLPVHPWQFTNRLPELRRREGADRIVPLAGYTAPATPLLGLRTVVPHGTHRGRLHPHVKLPLDVLKQGSRRLLPTAEVHDGPRLTELLESILRDGAFDRLGVLGEFAGAGYRPSDSEGTRVTEPGTAASATADNLSALLRTNPYAHPLVEDGHVPVTAASLLADRPGTGEAVVRGFVERYAGAEGISRSDEAAHEFLEAYVECLVPGALRLVSEYGIGLEPHLQNTVVVFDRDGRPRAALVRDFEGIRMDTRRLDARGYDVDLYPGSAVDATVREMHELYYALFFVQFGDLIVALVREFGVDERACWRVVRHACEEAVEGFRADPAVPTDHVDRDAAELFGETAEGMAVLTKKLLGRRESPYYRAPNPLARDGPVVPTTGPS